MLSIKSHVATNWLTGEVKSTGDPDANSHRKVCPPGCPDTTVAVNVRLDIQGDTNGGIITVVTFVNFDVDAHKDT